jgi:hypothetical protein
MAQIPLDDDDDLTLLLIAIDKPILQAPGQQLVQGISCRHLHDLLAHGSYCDLSLLQRLLQEDERQV